MKIRIFFNWQFFLQLMILVGFAGGCYSQSVIPEDSLEWSLDTRLGFTLKGDLPATITDWTIVNDRVIGSFKASLDQLSLTYPSNENAKNMSEQLLEANFLGCSICVGEVEMVIDKKHPEVTSGTIAYDGRIENLKFTVLQDENRLFVTTGINRRDFDIDFDHLGALGALMNFLLKDTIALSGSLLLSDSFNLKSNQ